jgi:hypothetical protein
MISKKERNKERKKESEIPTNQQLTRPVLTGFKTFHSLKFKEQI